MHIPLDETLQRCVVEVIERINMWLFSELQYSGVSLPHIVAAHQVAVRVHANACGLHVDGSRIRTHTSDGVVHKHHHRHSHHKSICGQNDRSELPTANSSNISVSLNSLDVTPLRPPPLVISTLTWDVITTENLPENTKVTIVTNNVYFVIIL